MQREEGGDAGAGKAYLPTEGGASGMGVPPASRPWCLARVHEQDARATLLASRARARRHRKLTDVPTA